MSEGGRRAVLTAAGKFFLDSATVILNEYESTLLKLKGFQTQPTLRLGTLRTIRISSLAGLIGAFQAQHPHVLIELLDGSLTELRDWLEQGDAVASGDRISLANRERGERWLRPLSASLSCLCS